MQKKRRVAGTPQDPGDSRELLRSIIQFMRQNQQLSLKELIDVYDCVSPQESIPLSVFATTLSPSESLCKFLKEERALSFHEIAVLLNRDDRSVWTSYTRSARKSRARLKIKGGDILIPISLFQDRNFSVLENVVHHLKTAHNLPNSRIAEALDKNPAAIATVANRVREKKGKGKRGKSKNV